MAATTTPMLLITNGGLAAASVAAPEGPYIHITYFEIGSGYGYTPTASQTGITGSLLYGGPTTPPTTYKSIGNNILDIVCNIPPDAGPWQFGEVALFLADGTMFAIAVFDTPQTKFSSLGTNVVSSYELNCLIKLQQSTAVFQIDTALGPPAVLDIYQWSDVYPANVSANPDIPLYLVHELNHRGDSTLLQQTSKAYWSLSTGYKLYSPKGTNGTFFTVQASSTSWVEVAASQCHTLDVTTTSNREFVVETANGFFRSVSSVVTSGGNYRFNLNVTNDGTYNNFPLGSAPPVGSGIRILRSDQEGGSIYYSQIVDPPAGYTLPAATTTTLGGIIVGSNLSITPSGVLSGAAPYTLPIASGSTLGGVKIGAGIVEAGDGTISAPYTPPIGAGWSNRGGTTSGTFTETNTTGHVVAYIFQGGQWNSGGGSGDLRQNPTDLEGSVDGNHVVSFATNVDIRANNPFIIVLVPPGSTVQCTSNPYSAAGPGGFSIMTFTGLMV